MNYLSLNRDAILFVLFFSPLAPSMNFNYSNSPTIFIHKNVKRVCPPFRGSLLGLGVFTTMNFTLPGKEAH